MKSKKRSIAMERKEFKTNLSLLVENEMEKAEVILSAKGILDDIQDVAEKIARIEVSELMPLMDALRASYGKTVADNFSQVVTDSLRSTVESLRTSKDTIGNEILKLEQTIDGEPMNDMALDDGEDFSDEADEDDFDMDLDDDSDDMEDDEDLEAQSEPEPEPEPEQDEDDFDDVFKNDDAPGVGRAKKESISYQKKMLENKKRSHQEKKLNEAKKRLLRRL